VFARLDGGAGVAGACEATADCSDATAAQA